MNKNLKIAATLLLSFVVQAAWSRDYRPDGRRPAFVGPTSGARIQSNCQQSSSRVFLDINNVRTMLLNGGDMFWDLDNPQYEVPKQDDVTRIKRHSLFAGALWIGGIRNGDQQLALAAVTYRNNPSYSYWPGPVNETTRAVTLAECNAFNRHFKINKEDVDNFIGDFFDGLITDIRDVPDIIRFWPARGNIYMQDDNNFQGINFNRTLAPFIDSNNDNIYDPLAGDYPDVRGNQMIWWVMNDVGNVKTFPNQNPVNIGMEIRVEAFGFSAADARNDMTFYRNRLLNRGIDAIDRCYFAKWVDPDLGFAGDDYVECDVPRGLGICYNGDDFDDGTAGYGENPPSVGVDFFIGPIADEGDGVDNDKNGTVDELRAVDLGCSGEIRLGEPIIMSNFVYYNIGSDPVNGDPRTPLDHYRYMQSIWKTGDTMTFDFRAGRTVWDPLQIGTQGYTAICKTSFMFPGSSDQLYFWSCGGSVQNPGGPLGFPSPNNFVWNEVSSGNAPGDRRFLQSAGPFTLRPGANNETTVAVVWARVDAGGSTGSFNKLKAASDQAQELFDNCFKNIEGPNAPDITVTELDREIILSLTPDEYVVDGQRVTTFTYSEVVIRNQVPFPVNFQGYQIYQLSDNTATTADIGNPNKVRIIAQSDIKDGIGRIINFEPAPWDPTDPSFFVPVEKVNGADNGIQNVIRITEDAFSTESDRRLVNYKTYYFTVVAYGFTNAPVGSRGKEAYIQGSGNVRSVSAIPSKRIGTVLNAVSGENIAITRLGGIGNSARTLEISKETRDSIVANNVVSTIPYTGAPFRVSIYDPTRIVDARLQMRLFSRIEYEFDSSKFVTFQKGDTIIAYDPKPAGTQFRFNSRRFLQVPGVAVVDSVLDARPRRTFTGRPFLSLRVIVLNSDRGGTFKIVEDSLSIPTSTIVDTSFIRMLPFVKRSTLDTLLTSGYELNDLYQIDVLNRSDIRPIVNNSPLSRGNDQIIPSLGIAVNIGRVPDPTSIYSKGAIPANGFQSASLSFADENRRWLSVITDTTFAFRAESIIPQVEIQDKSVNDNGGIFRRNLIGSSVVPYMFTEPVGRTQLNSSNQVVTVPIQFAASYAEPAQSNGLSLPDFGFRMERVSRIGNVDVVFTNDQTKWTRVAVLQHQGRQNQGSGASATVNGFIVNQNRFRMLKSPLVSLDRNLIPDSSIRSQWDNTQLSRGMSWFPGYAVDIDRGVRLNMAFCEDREQNLGVLDINGRPVGNNLIWEPTSDRTGSNNFIYVFNTVYDGGINLERELDSLAPYRPRPGQTGTGGSLTIPNVSRLYQYYMNNIDWAMLFRLPTGAQVAETDATIKIRLDKQYNLARVNNNISIPTYFFEVKGKAPERNVPTVLSEQLDIIRVAPNPYYAYSQYERNQVDNRIKVLNLPNKASIDIYTINGTLVRKFQKDDQLTFIDWDLKNGDGIPIAGGVYLIHVVVPGIGERTIKWFGVTRPLDLDTF
jgi:hypothetical protein